MPEQTRRFRASELEDSGDIRINPTANSSVDHLRLTFLDETR
jgi:hypothetical protein